MKINLFYKIGDYYGSYPKPILYAYTDNIEFAKEFRKTRRKDMFIEKEIKCDREEFYKLSLKQPNSLLLQSNVMSKNDNAFKGFDIIPIVMTKFEEESLLFKADITFQKIIPLLFNDMIKVNDEMIKALNILGYWDFCNYYLNNTGIIDYHVDFFNLFLYFYGDMFIKDN